METILVKYGKTKSLRHNYFELGRTLLEEREYQRAQQAFITALENEGSTPAEWELLYLLGKSNQSQGNSVEAIRVYLTGALKYGDNSSVFFKEANNQLSREVARSVYSWLQSEWMPQTNQISFSEEQQEELSFLLSRLHLYLGNYSEAEKGFSDLSERARDHLKPKVLEGLAQSYFEAGKLNEAKLKFFEAAELVREKDERSRILLKYIQALISTGDHEEAAIQLEEIKKVSNLNQEQQFEIKILEAQCLQELHQWENSLSIVDRLLDQKKEHIELHLIKINNLIALNQYKDAIIQIEQALQYDPLNEYLLFLNIQALVEGQINLEKAKDLFLAEEGYWELVNHHQDDLVSKLSKITASRPEDGHCHLFAAYIYHWIGLDNNCLKHRDLAEDLGLSATSDVKGPDKYPTIGIFLLDGQRNTKNKQFKEAIIAYFKVAQRYNWQRNNPESKQHFQKAYQLMEDNQVLYEDLVIIDEDFRKFHWSFAESLLMNSYITYPPYVDQQVLEEARKIWYESPENPVSRNSDYWAYHMIALIHENNYRFCTENATMEYWKAVCYVERALIHNDTNYWTWSYLGKCYHNLMLDMNGLAAVDEALQISGEELFPLEEKAVALLDLGLHHQAIQVLDQLMEHEEATSENQATYLGWKGFVKYHDEQYHEAIELFESYIQNNPKNLWGYTMKAMSLWHSYRWSEAKKVAEVIWDYRNNSDYQSEPDTFGWAAFVLGKLTDAKEYFNRYGRLRGNHRDPSHGLTLLFLRTGEIEEADKYFDDTIYKVSNPRRIKDLLRDLEALEKLPQEEKTIDQSLLIKTLNTRKTGWKDKIRSRLTDLNNRPISLEQEFEEILEGDLFEIGSWPWTTLQAGLARIHLKQGQHSLAHKAYKRLEKSSQDFPEAKLALQKLSEDLLNSCKRSISQSEYGMVEQQLAEVILDDQSLKPQKYLLLSLAQLGLGKIEKAKESLIQCNLKSQEQPGPEILGQLQDIILEAVVSDQLYWQFEELLDSLVRGSGNKIQDGVLLKLNQNLPNYWVQKYGKAESLNMLPVVTPIALELSNDLIPEGDDSDWVIFKEYIPELRTWYSEHYGISVPGIRIRPNAYNMAGNYVILFDEVPVVSGTISKDEIFVPRSFDDIRKILPDAKLTEAKHPFTGAPAVWAFRDAQSILEKQGIEYWSDPLLYITEHLKKVIMGRMDYFYDLQYTDDYLHQWIEKKPDQKEWVKGILSDVQQLTILNKVIKGLLIERVPVVAKDEILHAFQEVDQIPGEINDTIRFIRSHLKQWLPGNQPGVIRVVVPTDLEGRIQQDLKTIDGRTFLAMLPNDCQDVLTELRNFIQDSEPLHQTVLQVVDGRVRAYLRKLIQLEHPDLMVIAEEEVI